MSREQFQSPFQASFNVRPAAFEVLEERGQETVQPETQQGDSMIVSRADAKKVTWSNAVFPTIGEEVKDGMAVEEPLHTQQDRDVENLGTELSTDSDMVFDEAEGTQPDGPCPNCEEMEGKLAVQAEAMEARLEGPISAAVESMSEAVFQLNRQMHVDVVDLAKKLAESIIRKEVSMDNEVLLRTTEEALKIAGPIQSAVIVCHPEDQEIITQHLNRLHAAASTQLVDLSVETDSQIERGGCRVRFADGDIDARLESQLSHLADYTHIICFWC